MKYRYHKIHCNVSPYDASNVSPFLNMFEHIMCDDIVSASASSPSDARRLKINNIMFYSVVLHTYFDIGTLGLLRRVVKIL